MIYKMPPNAHHPKFHECHQPPFHMGACCGWNGTAHLVWWQYGGGRMIVRPGKCKLSPAGGIARGGAGQLAADDEPKGDPTSRFTRPARRSRI